MGEETESYIWPGPEPSQDDLLKLARKGRNDWNVWRRHYPCKDGQGPTADFSGVDFTRDDNWEIDFSGFEFGDKAKFSAAIFGLNANFCGAIFGDLADF